MKLLSRGKELEAYSSVEGIIRAGYDKSLKKCIIKLDDLKGKRQFVVEFNQYECGLILAEILFGCDEAVRYLVRWYDISKIVKRVKKCSIDNRGENT
jgi:hypothetical protein